MTEYLDNFDTMSLDELVAWWEATDFTITPLTEYAAVRVQMLLDKKNGNKLGVRTAKRVLRDIRQELA